MSQLLGFTSNREDRRGRLRPAWLAGRGGYGPPALSAAFAACLITLAAGYTFGVGGLRMAGVLGALFLGIGTAPLQLSSGPTLPVRLGVAGLVGLVVMVGLGALMVLLPLWYPVPVAAVLGGIAGGVHLLSVRRAVSAQGPSVFGLRRAGQELRSRLSPAAGAWRVGPLCSLIGTVLWILAAATAGHVNPSLGGFLTHISPLWYVGLALVLAGIAFGGRDRESHLALAVLSLALATTLTPALLYGMPRTSSAAKHMDVVLMILRHHHLTPSSEHDPAGAIYLVYSGFFAGVAWMMRLANVSNPLGIATYWPVLLAFLRVIELRFLTGRVVSSRYRCWLAVMLAVLVDSLGADYFSPQSVGFVMGLALFALVLDGPGEPGLGGRWVAPLLVLSGYAMAPTHELSPFMVGGMFIILTLFGLARPPWAPVALLGPAAAWAVLNHGVVGKFFSLSSLLRFSNLFPPQTAITPGHHRLAIVSLSSFALTGALFVLVFLALAGLLRNRREPWAWAFILCPGVGLALTLVNPYGNEGIFRSTLFAIPWLAVLAVCAIGPVANSRLGRVRIRPRVARVIVLVVSLGLLGAFVTSAFGLDGGRVLLRSDWAARLWFEREAPRNSYLMPIGYGENPVSSPIFTNRVRVVGWGRFVGQPLLGRDHPVAADVKAVTTEYERYASGATPNPALFVSWSPRVPLYEREYGLQTQAQADAWLQLFLASDRWRVVFAQGGSYVLRLVGFPRAS